MKQVCMTGGQIAVVDVPPPVCGPRQVLVRTSHSLISTGTELAMTGGGGDSLIRKAIANPQLVRKVWEKATTVGVGQTLDLVRARATSSLALGYSASGVVVEVGSDVMRFAAGDRVACAGAGHANHAEFNVVPENLTARIPPGVSFQDAAFATLGAIALQGVRRMEPTLGEQVVVVGLGLIGQLTVQLLRQAGCRTFGIEPVAARLELARARGLEDGVTPDATEAPRAVRAWTGGDGADAVIVCASAGDPSLLNRAFELCRPKGRVVLVGDVPIRIARDRIYKRELDFRISCSYGPGRYDPRYEEQGIDYPIGYVRWTEGRNLGEVLRLLGSGGLTVADLIGQTFPVDDATAAYQSLQSERAPVAVLLDYGLREGDRADPGSRVRQIIVRRSATHGRIRLGVVGAGSFFQAVHLPALAKTGAFEIVSIASRTGLALRDLASKYRIARVTTDASEIITDSEVDAVLIATRHDLHARYVLAALDAGKHVFVEKPLALTTDECRAIADAAVSAGRIVMVGFNRRFSPHAQRARALLDAVRTPKMIVYRVNAGALPADHWLRDPVEGGGRLLGEGVHFFDFIRWMLRVDPLSVHASALRVNGPDPDNAAITLTYRDGSCGVVVYTSDGAADLGKERIEMFGGGRSLVIDDFMGLSVYGGGGGRQRPGTVQKGHLEILQHFADALAGKLAPELGPGDGYWATWCAEQALAGLRGPAGARSHE